MNRSGSAEADSPGVPRDVEALARAMEAEWPGWLLEAPGTEEGREEMRTYAAALLGRLTPADRLAIAGITEERLAAAGFDPPNNVCNACKHPGGDHDLGNWCLVCPRPAVLSHSFGDRVAAGWCYFASMDESQKWAYGLAALSAGSATPAPEASREEGGA